MSKPTPSKFLSYSPEQKALHMELTYQMKENKRLEDEADYLLQKGTLTLKEHTKLQTQIALDYHELKTKLTLNINKWTKQN